MRADTVEPAGAERTAGPARLRAGSRWIRGVAGVLAGGLAVLALVVLAAEAVAAGIGVRGPGAVVAVGHAVAAVLAVGAAALADRMRGVLAAVAVTGVLVISASTLWVFWLH